MPLPHEIELQQQQAAQGAPVSTLSPLYPRPVQQLSLTPPPAPVRQPQVVDRVLYNQQQRQAQIEAEQSRRLEEEAARRRLLELYAMAQRTIAPVQRLRQRAEQLAAGEDEGGFLARVQDAYNAIPAPVRRMIPGVREIEGLRQNIPGTDITGYDILRADIPGARRVQQAAGGAARAAAAVPSPLDVLPGIDTRPFRKEAAEVVAEALVPTEVWDTALTLVPAAKAKTVGELIGALTIGDVDAVRALKQAGAKVGTNVDPVLRALSSERGALEPEKLPVPDSVIQALRKRGRRDVVPVDPDALQAQWDLLPPTYQKMIISMSDAVLSPSERKLITKAGRSRQGAAARMALEDATGSTVERAAAARAAMTGRIIPSIKPIREQFSPQEVDEVFAGVDKAFAEKIINPFEHPNAVDALSLLFDGTRVFDHKKPLNLMPGEIKLLGRIFGPEFEAVLPRTAAELTNWQRAIDIANLPRSLITAIDFSAAGRQGALLGPRNPAEWGRGWGPMMRSMGSEEGYERVLNMIRTNPKFEEAITVGKIDFSDIGGGVNAEEAFISGLASKVPGVRRSERGYNAFLNTLRMGVYEKYSNRIDRTAAKWGWDEARIARAKEQIGHFINVASGRGDLGGLKEYTPAMNVLFFSPRYLVSRVQSVWDLVKPGVDPAVRQMIFENLVTFVGLGTGLLALAVTAGTLAHERYGTPKPSVELNPQSSDFGKLRIGDQRIDFWAGFQPLVRYIAQFGTGKRKELETGELIPQYRGETALRFFRSKLSPAGSMIYDLTVNKGKSFEGRDTAFVDPVPSNIWREFRERLLPLTLQDALEAYDAQGLGAGITAGIVSGLGGGVSTFEPSEEQQKKVARAGIDKKMDEAGFPRAEVAFKESYWQNQFKQAFPGIDLSKYETLEDLKAAAVEAWAPQIEAVNLAEARAEASRAFDGLDVVKAFRAGEKYARLQWMRDNRELALEAAKAGAFGELSDEEEEALGID